VFSQELGGIKIEKAIEIRIKIERNRLTLGMSNNVHWGIVKFLNLGNNMVFFFSVTLTITKIPWTLLSKEDFT